MNDHETFQQRLAREKRYRRNMQRYGVREFSAWSNRVLAVLKGHAARERKAERRAMRRVG